jgi:hypothetical protein
MIKNLDTSSKCYWTYWMVNRWILLRYDWLGAFVVGSVMLLVTAFGGASGSGSNEVHYGGLHSFWDSVHRIKEQASGGSGGFEGLAITTAMSFTLYVYFGVRFISQLELDLK